MNTFCSLAFIPSMILVVWLLIELRKFVMVRKDLKVVETSLKKERNRKYRELSESEEYPSEPPRRSRPPRHDDYYEKPPHDHYDEYSDYDENGYHEAEPRQRPRRHRMPTPPPPPPEPGPTQTPRPRKRKQQRQKPSNRPLKKRKEKLDDLFDKYGD